MEYGGRGSSCIRRSAFTDIACPADLVSSTVCGRVLFSDLKRILLGRERDRYEKEVSLLDSIPQRNGETISRKMEKEGIVLILNMRSGNIYVYEGEKAIVWELCNGERTCRQIIRDLRDRNPETQGKEVSSFIRRLAGDGLINLTQKHHD